MRLEPGLTQDNTRETYNGAQVSRTLLPEATCSNYEEDHASRGQSLVDDPLLRILESIGCGGIMRNVFGKVIGINRAAMDMLAREVGATDLARADSLSPAVERLLNRASARVPADGKSWVTVRRDRGRPLAIYRLPVAVPPGRTILILVDMETCLEPRPLNLQRLFGLTAAETKLASAIALGSAPTDLARRWHLSTATVRSQLASIFCKTHTRRQSELVALLARISTLP
jgi:DNA-binding CsgD family transcriptional regulator